MNLLGILSSALCLAKALSTHLSTAALDKNPQSRERGLTSNNLLQFQGHFFPSVLTTSLTDFILFFSF